MTSLSWTVIGHDWRVESSDGAAMKASIDAGELVTLERCDTVIDGLRVKRVGRHTFELVSRFVDEIVTVPDEGGSSTPSR